MLCEIAELRVQLPEAGGLAPRCRDYLTTDGPADIVITEDQYDVSRWPGMSYENMCYMESGELFIMELFQRNGLMLHASAVELDGYAYLFSGPSTVGKSTHTKLWQQMFGPAAQVFNDDKPVLRFVDDRWYAYGTPWCGKDGINQNKKVPVGGICFLKQGTRENIRRLEPKESLPRILWQTLRSRSLERTELLLSNMEKLVERIPVYELENRPIEAAARLSYETMRRTLP